ncbi:MAG: SoxR reducing system RseC family protein [Spirochaetes bacterium]|nr:SoxR reducing system RseC family protein [Spirochaetota bacterium]
MIEQGKVIKIKEMTAEIEIPSNSNCAKCGACLASSSSTRVISVKNNGSVRPGDTVEIFIDYNRIGAAFSLYIIPLLSFFLFFITSMTLWKIKDEGILVLIGFSGFFLSYLIIRVLTAKRSIKNYIIKKVR